MAKDPAVLFYTSDFLSGTFTMDYEQKGKYITLLCIQHQKGFLTEKDLKAVLIDTDIEVFNKFILADDGFYYNLKMKECAEKRKAYSESRRNNRKSKSDKNNDMNSLSKRYEEHMINTSKSYDKHMETGNENEYINANQDAAANEIIITKPMLERIMDKFINIDSRFKFNSVMMEIDEDYGGFDNLIEMYLPNDISAQTNWKKQLQQYKNGIYA